MKKALFVFIFSICIVTGFLLFLSNQEPDTCREKTNPIVIGVILVGPKRDGGWSEAHYNGFETLKKKMNIQLIYKEHISDQDNSIIAAISELVADDAEIIFATSYDYGKYLKQCAMNYPQIKFFHATGIEMAPNLATYFGRIYQARYLTGIVAGLQTKTNHLGYVAAFPISEVVRGINAFTLGARSVNPGVIVHVAWTKNWNRPDVETKVTRTLLDTFPIDVLAQHQNTTNPVEVAQERHIYAIGYNLDRRVDYPDTFLTAPIWNWASFYQERLTECFEGRFEGKNYWKSIENNMLDIAPLHPKVSQETVVTVQKAKERMLSQTWDVFYGPIKDQQGNLRVADGENMPDEQLLNQFNWFVQGVDGSLIE